MTNSVGRGWPLRSWWIGSLMGFHTKRLSSIDFPTPSFETRLQSQAPSFVSLSDSIPKARFHVSRKARKPDFRLSGFLFLKWRSLIPFSFHPVEFVLW